MYSKFTGIIAALILFSTVQYLYYARNGMLDVTVTFFITMSLFSFYYALYKAKNKDIGDDWHVIAGVFVGLGVMTKSIVGLLPVGIMAVFTIYLFFFQKKKRLSIKSILFIIAGASIIALPWHVYSYIAHGQHFIDSYLLDHILSRGLSGFGHEQGMLWFLIVIKTSFRIWIFPLFGALFFLPFKDKKRDELVFLFISVIAIFSFFLISKDKLVRYIMPIYPFLALLSARFIDVFYQFVLTFIKVNYAKHSVIYRSVIVMVIFVFVPFYIVLNRGIIYYPDANKDKVALIKIHNQLYPTDEYPDLELNYEGIEPPILLFYSDHGIGAVDKDKVLNMIEDAKPTQFYTFLVREGTFYKLKKLQSEVDVPIAFDVKGSAGEWVLLRSKSRVEILHDQYARLLPEYTNLRILEIRGLQMNRSQKDRIRGLREEIANINKKLLEYRVSEIVVEPDQPSFIENILQDNTQ